MYNGRKQTKRYVMMVYVAHLSPTVKLLDEIPFARVLSSFSADVYM